MSETAIDALSRRAAAITLGGAALGTALTGAIGAEAAKNPGKKAKKKARKKCKRQRGQCLSALPSVCEAVFGAEDVPACVLFFDECCEPLRGCNVSEAAACLVRRINQI